MIIYKTTNIVNQKFYVGKDIHNNPNYYGSGKLLKLAIKKYGLENFKKEVIEICESIDELNNREVFWIEKLNAIEGGYNISLGGEGGDTITNNPNKDKIALKHSEWMKKNNPTRGRKRKQTEIQKWRESIGDKLKGENNPMFGKNHSEETKEKISQKALGREISEETKEKISNSNKGKVGYWKGKKNKRHSEWMKQNNPFKGKTHTKEVRELLSKINSKPKSEEHKRKISETLKGNKPGNMRKVVVDGIEYESLSFAARQVGIPTSTMKNRLKSPKFDNYKYKG